MEELEKLAKEKDYNHSIPRASKDFIHPLDGYVWMCKLQKWLRERHELHVLVDCNAVGWCWFIDKTNGTYVADGDYEGPDPMGGRWLVYEEALEQGLKKALTLI